MNLLKNKKLLLLLGAVFLILFLVFTLMVKQDKFTQFDFNMTVKIQDKMPLKYDKYLAIFTMLGSFEVIVIPLLLLLVILRKKLFGAVTLFFFVCAHVTELIGKVFLTHPGPPFMFYRNLNSFGLPSNYIQPGSSYPSGHSFRSFFVALLIVYCVWTAKRFNIAQKLIVAVVAFGLAGMIVLAKVTLGQHWVSDIIAGAFLGIGLAFISLLFY